VIHELSQLATFQDFFWHSLATAEHYRAVWSILQQVRS
jgi:hypothetical protein